MGKSSFSIGWPFIFLVFLGLACLPLFLEDQYILQILIMTLFFAYLSSCWNLVGGGVGLFSMGHAAFLGLGAYTSTILFMNNHISPWIGMVAGGLTAIIAAIIIGYPCFKLRGVYFALSTLAFVSILQMVITTTRHVGGFDVGAGEGLVIPVLGQSPWQFQFLSKKYYYWTILGMLGLVTWVAYWLKTSKMGYYLLAIKLDQEAADSLGVNVVKYKLLCWCISAFLTALGGTFYAQLLLYIAPDRLFSIPLSIELIIITLIGGIGTIAGPIIGAFVLIPISEFLRMQLGGQYALIQVIIYGAILIFIILFLPKGIKEPLENGVLKIRKQIIRAWQRDAN